MVNNQTVWVVDDDQSIRWVLEKALGSAGFTIRSFERAAPALAALTDKEPAVLISDIRMPDMDGLQLLAQVQEKVPDLPVIIITAHSDLDSAVAAYQGGAFEYLPKPFDIADAISLTQRACLFREENAPPAMPVLKQGSDIIGESVAMQEVFRAIGRLSHSHINVLINGASGTGKELVAHALHKHSPRKKSSFIALNMAAIPKDLMESELFGHEKGAFTGAQNLRRGRFEQANHGTLFLDEIGDMPAELQTRLLRVLSDGQFYRVGGHSPVSVDVRIIAATHQDLEARVMDGSFREDLFHRLNVIRIQLPPLNQRREDIPLLMAHFLESAAKELEVEMKSVPLDVMDYLASLEWPGNVRQLENTARWLTVMGSGRQILMQDLPPDLMSGESMPSEEQGQSWQRELKSWADKQLVVGEGPLVTQALPEFEEVLIRAALDKTQGKRQEAAKALGWGRNTLTRKIAELNLIDL